MDYRAPQNLVLPSLWQGQIDCVVGPFSGKEVATYFVHFVLNLNYVATDADCIFAKGDAWYIRVPARAPRPARSREFREATRP